MRKDRSDTGQKNEYGTQKCPRCGKTVTKAGYGFNSHLKACLKRPVILNGKTYPAVKDE